MSNHFVNRFIEREKVKNIVKKNNVIIVGARTGVGKTSLINYFKSKDSSPLKLNVETASPVVQSTQNYYIQKLAEAIEIERNDNENVKIASYSLASKKKRFSIGTIIEFFDNLTGKNLKRALEMIFKNESPLAGKIDTQVSYIIDTLNANKSLVHIHNVESIDSNSFEKLMIIMESCTDTIFYLEFMFSDSGNDSDFYRFIEKVKKQNHRTGNIELGIFEEKHFYEYCDVNGFGEKKIDYYDVYREFNGDFVKLRYKSESNGSNIFTTFEKTISELSSDESMVFAIITMYFDRINESELYDVLKKINICSYLGYQELGDILNSLSRQKLICRIKSAYEVAHYEIKSNFLTSSSTLKFRLLSYKALVDYYNQKMNSYDKNSHEYRSCLENVILLRLRYDTESLMNTQMLHQIIELAVSYPHRKFAKEYLEMIEIELEKSEVNNKDSIRFAILDSYYSIGAFDDALRVINNIMDIKNDFHIAFKALILSRKDNIALALDYISDNESTITNQQAKLQIGIAKIIALIIHSDYMEKDRVYDQLTNQTHFLNYYEFGYLLKLAEERFANDISIPYIKEGISHFERHNDLIEASKTRITLAAQLGNVGLVDEAISELKKALDVLKNRSLEQRNILNNLGICFYLKDKSGIAELKSAYNLISSDMNKLMISNNIFSVLCMTSKHDEAIQYVEYIESVGCSYDYASIRMTSKFNLSVYYKEIGNHEKYNQLYQACYNELDKVDIERRNYWSARLDKTTYSDGGFARVFKEKYHLSFMSIWDFNFLDKSRKN